MQASEMNAALGGKNRQQQISITQVSYKYCKVDLQPFYSSTTKEVKYF